MPEVVRIELNGEPHEIAAGASLLDLLVALGREPRLVAVEHNGVVVPRARFGKIALAAGDRVEVVQFVQGG